MGLRPYLWGWAAYALFYFALGFHPGVVSGDDFGYLRSVLGTLASHRPYAYDWLEPYAACFSAACALLYALTGSFLAATWGFQAFCALAFYPLLARLLAARLRPGHAALLALSVAACPLFFAKASDFHAAFFTLDLVLIALIAFEARRWGWFFAAAFLAFANRQNQVCLLVLPWAQALREAGHGRGVTRAIPRGTALWAIAAAALAFSMNRTFAAAHAPYRSEPFAALAGHAILALAVGAYLALGCLSIASCVAGRAFKGRAPIGLALISRAFISPPFADSSASRKWLWPALAAAGLLALIPFWGPSLLLTDTPLFGMAGWPQVNRALPWILLVLLPLLDFRTLRPSPYLALMAAYVFLASLRGTWWDYYFLEISVLALLLALEGTPAPTLPSYVVVALALALAADCGYAYLYKVQSDKQRVAIAELEHLEREGRARVQDMTGASFGQLGWKLFDYYASHDGQTDGLLLGFLGYVRRDRIIVETGLPWRRGYKRELPSGADSLAGGFCRIGFATVPYRVVDVHGPAAEEAALGRALRLDPEFHAPSYPLNDGEWDAYIRTLKGKVSGN
ncbi:MAG: hypothetical protein JF616_08705 [Fibrobacteres bacterium]|nr:hypothetical protein [Fibrobacterota bacterium]